MIRLKCAVTDHNSVQNATVHWLQTTNA